MADAVSPLWFSFNSDGRFHGSEPPFFDPSEYPFLADLEAGWKVIRDETLALAEAEDGRLKPYLLRWMSFPPGEWRTMGLLFWKYPVADNLRRCPQTRAMLARIPNLTAAALSILPPHARIKPHFGDTNAIARIHLGLEIPGQPMDCAFQVGDEVRGWEEGRAHAFCDAHLHMAWNHTPRRRAILILDVMRPAFAARTDTICGSVLAAIFTTYLMNVLPGGKAAPDVLRLGFWKAGSAVMAALSRLRRRPLGA